MRILFVNPYGIGDVLFTTPAVRILKTHFPEAMIGYLCNERTKPVLGSNPNISELFVFEKEYYRRLWRENKKKCLGEFMELLNSIQSKKFEIALDYSLNRPIGFFIALIGIPTRIGYDYRNRGIFLNRKVTLKEYTAQHMAFFYAQLLRELGLAVNNIPNIEFPVLPSLKEWADEFLKSVGIGTKERFIVIHPGGGKSWGSNASYKRWPAESFSKLSELLAEHYHVKVLMVGDSSEAEIGRLNPSQKKGIDIVNAYGKFDLPQLAAVLGQAWFVVCNDGGPLHIAVSQGTRTVSFFGPVDATVYGPFPRENHLVLTNFVECRPCYRNFRFPSCPYEHRCLRGLTVEEAFERIRSFFPLACNSFLVS